MTMAVADFASNQRTRLIVPSRPSIPAALLQANFPSAAAELSVPEPTGALTMRIPALALSIISGLLMILIGILGWGLAEIYYSQKDLRTQLHDDTVSQIKATESLRNDVVGAIGSVNSRIDIVVAHLEGTNTRLDDLRQDFKDFRNHK